MVCNIGRYTNYVHDNQSFHILKVHFNQIKQLWIPNLHTTGAYFKPACTNILNQLDFVIRPNLFFRIAQPPQIVVIWNWSLKINTIDGRGTVVSIIVPQQNQTLPTYAVSRLFVSPIRLTYDFFVVVSEIFGAVYREMAVIYLSSQVRRWQRR